MPKKSKGRHRRVRLRQQRERDISTISVGSRDTDFDKDGKRSSHADRPRAAHVLEACHANPESKVTSKKGEIQNSTKVKDEIGYSPSAASSEDPFTVNPDTHRDEEKDSFPTSSVGTEGSGTTNSKVKGAPEEEDGGRAEDEEAIIQQFLQGLSTVEKIEGPQEFDLADNESDFEGSTEELEGMYEALQATAQLGKNAPTKSVQAFAEYGAEDGRVELKKETEAEKEHERNAKSQGPDVIIFSETITGAPESSHEAQTKCCWPGLAYSIRGAGFAMLAPASKGIPMQEEASKSIPMQEKHTTASKGIPMQKEASKSIPMEEKQKAHVADWMTRAPEHASKSDNSEARAAVKGNGQKRGVRIWKTRDPGGASMSSHSEAMNPGKQVRFNEAMIVDDLDAELEDLLKQPAVRDMPVAVKSQLVAILEGKAFLKVRMREKEGVAA